MKNLTIGFIAWTGMFCATAWAGPLALNYGPNVVDINADDAPDLIIRTRWENFNAHSFDRYLVMVRLNGPDYPHALYEVAKDDQGPDYTFHTTEGADCTRTAYTFSLDSKGMLTVTRYMLEAGKNTYCEPSPLTVTTYHLTDSVKEQGMPLPGLTPYYLKKVKETVTQKRYADVSGL